MELSRFESFNITIADDITLTITKIGIGEETIFYEVSSFYVVHGKIFPVFGDSPFIQWTTIDDIDQIFVNQIGHAIENHG